jgi:hypothetical protein
MSAGAAGKDPMEQSVSFGSYRFDVGSARLWAGTREVRLTPKASAVLKVLVTRAGEQVTKEDLFASVWTDTVVTDDALTSCIQELRRALELYPDVMSAMISATCLHAQLGQKDQALDMLERLVARGWCKRDWIEHDPDYDSLRDDPRFKKLLARLK